MVQLQESGYRMENSPYRLLPFFELIIPLLIWIVSEIKFKKKKKSQTPATKANPELTQS